MPLEADCFFTGQCFVPASLPFIQPCQPRPAKKPPAGDRWLHQPKLDGWRVQGVKRGSDAALFSRYGRDLTERYPVVAEAIRKLPCPSCSLDGELVLATKAGIDFYGLRGARRHDDVSLWAFDILELDGADLRGLPLIERTARLAKLMTRSKDPALGLVPSFDDGQALLLACMDKGVEGIVSKLRDAPYRPGSRPEWLKVKAPGWTAQNRDRWEKLRG